MPRPTRVIELEFFTKLNELLGKFEKMSSEPHILTSLDRLRRRIGIARRSLGDEYLLDLARPVFMKYADIITSLPKLEAVDVDEVWSATRDKIDDTEFVYDLVVYARGRFLEARPREKTIIHRDLLMLLSLCTEVGV